MLVVRRTGVSPFVRNNVRYTAAAVPVLSQLVRGVTHDASHTESSGQNVESPSSSATDPSPAQPTSDPSATPAADTLAASPHAQGESAAEIVITPVYATPTNKSTSKKSITRGFLSRLANSAASETSNGDAVDDVWKSIMQQPSGEVTFGPPKRGPKGFGLKGAKSIRKSTNPRRPQATFDMPGSGTRGGPPTNGAGPTWSSEEWRNTEAEILKDKPDLITKPKALRELILNALEEKMESVDVSIAATRAATSRNLDLPPHLRLDGIRRSDIHVLDDKSVSQLHHKLSGRTIEQVSDDELIEVFEEQTKKQIDSGRDDNNFIKEIARGTFHANSIAIDPVTAPRNGKVARLARGLRRVLFSEGVHCLRDPRSGVWNFDKTLGKIPNFDQFAYHRLPQYITASRDEELAQMAADVNTKFIGSTSTLTKALSQIYFTISGGKPVNLSHLSQAFAGERNDYTAGASLPAAIVVRLLPNGTYGIDNIKDYDVEENVLSDYGRILEKFLTVEQEDFERFLNSSPESAVPEEERTEREAYAYSKSKGILMRSQLDCQDIRLPGNGTFDIKTRACQPIRHDRANYAANSAYNIAHMKGMTNSFENEYYELARSGMLKYNFQARIGQMDGIFVAYHNTARLFGFQYLSLEEIDQVLYGSSEMGNQAFKLSVSILEEILTQAAALFPNQSFNLVMKRLDFTKVHDGNAPNKLQMAVEPTEWTGEGPKPVRTMDMYFNSSLDDKPIEGPVSFSEDPKVRANQKWSVQYNLTISDDSAVATISARRRYTTLCDMIKRMSTLVIPEGKNLRDMDPERAAAEEALLAVPEEGEESDPMGLGLEYDDVDDVDTVRELLNDPSPAKVLVQDGSADIVSPAETDAVDQSEAEAVAEPAEEVEAAASTSAPSPETYATDRITPAVSSATDGPLKVWWTAPNEKVRKMRRHAKATGREYDKIKSQWKPAAATSSWWDAETEALERVASFREAKKIKRDAQRAAGEIRPWKPAKHVREQQQHVEAEVKEVETETGAAEAKMEQAPDSQVEVGVGSGTQPEESGLSGKSA